MRSGALEMFLWYVLMAVWIFGMIAAIVHLVVRVHAPTWAVVLAAVAMIVVPVIPVVIYWAVIAGRRMIRPAAAPLASPPPGL
jgi:hypothetical protein